MAILNNSDLSVISVAKPKKFVAVAFTYVSESPAWVYVDFLLKFVKCWQR
jgi:hypothetical protein